MFTIGFHFHHSHILLSSYSTPLSPLKKLLSIIKTQWNFVKTTIKKLKPHKSQDQKVSQENPQLGGKSQRKTCRLENFSLIGFWGWHFEFAVWPQVNFALNCRHLKVLTCLAIYICFSSYPHRLATISQFRLPKTCVRICSREGKGLTAVRVFVFVC